MKHLIVLMLVLIASVSAESLYYWDATGEEQYNSSIWPWHGVKFEFADFPGWIGMTIHELELGFWCDEPEDSVMIFIFDGEDLPDGVLSLETLADLALCAFFISPLDSMNVYELPGPVDVGQVDGVFWVLVYTENSLQGENKLAVDLNTPYGHTYSNGTAGVWNDVGQSPFEAHVTVNGYPWTMSLESVTWGSLKTNF